MTKKSNLQLKTENMLAKYINRFLRYAKFSHIPQDRKEILVGTFLYLLDEDDTVPDDVPHIGLLDDLIVFVEVAKHFLGPDQSIPGVCNEEELAQDSQFVEDHKALMYGACAFSVTVIRKHGQKLVDLPTLCSQIRSKYAHLGGLEE